MQLLLPVEFLLVFFLYASPGRYDFIIKSEACRLELLTFLCFIQTSTNTKYKDTCGSLFKIIRLGRQI